MQFISVTFISFLGIVFLLNNIIPKKYTYVLLLFANYIFYGWNNLSVVPILLLATILSYVGGLVLEKKKKRAVYGLFFGASISILLVYKYLNFILSNISLITETQYQELDLITPIGLSFYIFQSTSYLNDIYRKEMSAEKNFIKYAAFVSFFPTVLSGPIQRSRDLLPQINSPLEFSYDRGKKGIKLLVWGFFQKLIVANQLAFVVNYVYNDYLSYDNLYYLFAAICYSFYIYCDFSSYSDMACGVALILGYDIKPNFRNPYLAESLAEFWNRWHMSLNTWFVENIYIPLGGNRKGELRKYINIFIVFFVSGIWHGASWTFIFWGVLNGLLRIFGEILKPVRDGIRKWMRIKDSGIGIRTLRRCMVFFLITITWVFFRMPDIGSALHIIRNMLLFLPSSILVFNPMTIFTTTSKMCSFAFSLIIFVVIQYLRREEGSKDCVMEKIPNWLERLILAILICCCVFAACSNTTTLDTQFIYFQF